MMYGDLQSRLRTAENQANKKYLRNSIFGLCALFLTQYLC